MTEPDAKLEGWRAEVLGYLLGRPSSAESIHRLPAAVELPEGALRWWMFEGKAYPCLRDPGADSMRLSQSWGEVAREIGRLRQHYNPRQRVVDHPGEPVDWPRTYALGAGWSRFRTYVVQSSARGLSEAEWAALCGWARWISGEWKAFGRAGKGFEAFMDETKDLREAGVALDSGLPPDAQLRLHDRWLRAALRSRWPLLRHLVAESLRCFSPQGLDIDRVPLPTTPYRLFELVGTVRLMRALHPEPEALNWLAGENAVCLGGTTFQLQQSWDRKQVISEAYSGPGLNEDVFKAFGLRVHHFADLAILQPGNGFGAILVEFKSGSQDFSYALHQLRVYQRMARREGFGRLVLWGIVETPKAEHRWFGPTKRSFIEGRVGASTAEDVWVFSSAEPEDIRQVLGALGLIQEPLGAQGHSAHHPTPSFIET